MTDIGPLGPMPGYRNKGADPQESDWPDQCPRCGTDLDHEPGGCDQRDIRDHIREMRAEAEMHEAGL